MTPATAQHHETKKSLARLFRANDLGVWRGSKLTGNKGQKAARVSMHNSFGDGSVVIIIGIDPTLPESVRAKRWEEKGRELSRLVEEAGYTVDYTTYDTFKDWRTFRVVGKQQ